MNREQSHIDEWLKQQLEGAEFQPAPELWDAIEAKMDRSTRRKPLIWWAAAAAVLVSGLGVWAWNKQLHSSENVTSSNSPVIEKPTQDPTESTSVQEEEVLSGVEAKVKSAAIAMVRSQPSLLHYDQEELSIVEPLHVPQFVPYSRGLSSRVFLW
ncbi:MAG: hypothetical protein RL577_1012, partial [Bacteroidota bacterium]